ncbi:hypothetical protein ACFHYQ_13435, partial [Sphaerimonospora cavernae]
VSLLYFYMLALKLNQVQYSGVVKDHCDEFLGSFKFLFVALSLCLFGRLCALPGKTAAGALRIRIGLRLCLSQCVSRSVSNQTADTLSLSVCLGLSLRQSVSCPVSTKTALSQP